MSARCTPRTPLRQLGCFAAVGAASTAAQAVIYLLSRQALSLTAAGAVALVLTTALTTEAHRRLTFRGCRPAPTLRVHLQAGGTSAVAYALVLAVVLGVDALPPDAQPVIEVAVLTAAGAAVGLLRFAALRVWVFPARRPTVGATAPCGGGSRTADPRLSGCR